MKRLCLLTLVTVAFELVQSQKLEVIPESWLPDNFPNPLKKHSICGLGKTPGYVCDPNRILTQHQLTTLNWFLQGIADTVNTDQCPCSRYFCENHVGQRFYKVAVALIPRLSIPRNTDGRQVSVLDQANIFAYRLEHDVWNMSSCEEDIVILYSRDDRALVTMTGQTAGRKLDALTRKVIHGMVGQAFAEGRINEGLERMVYEIEMVLNGKKNYHGMFETQTGGAGRGCHGSSWLLLLPLALGSAWWAQALTLTGPQ
ncbi:uncharacterized protein LOC143283351 [Babylonia areolata]|uniref:uncharacterized protein LOC143283351 n=1 Tax=Babylonia areolata TaxID=304850 RepID=UPI003FD3BE20